MKKTFIITLFSIFLSVFLFGCKVKTPSVEITLTSELNSVSYSLKFNDIEEDRNYKVTLSVAEKQVAEKVNTVKNNTGKFDNLEYNREYFLEVYIGEKANSKEYTTKLGESKISTNVLKFENVKLEGQTFTYDGTAKSISVTGAPEGTNIEYTGNGVTEVGEHTVSAKLTKEGYEDLTLTAKIVIVKSSVDFELNDVEVVYSGEPVEVEVETELELTYEYYLGETKLESAPVNAGTYTVKAIYAGNAGVEGLTKSATLTIKKADTTITAANVTKVYDGAQAVVTATVSNGDVPVITYDTQTGDAPSQVGTYTATVSYAGNENYSAAESVTVNIVISQKEAEITMSNKEVTYNGEAQTITATTVLPVTYEYYLGETKLNSAPVNAGIYTVKAIFEGNEVCKPKTVEATLTIKKADTTITAADVTKVYDGNAAVVTATVSNGATAVIAYPNETAPVNAGTYTVTVSYAGNENYNAAANVTVTVTISKVVVEFELEDIEITYGETYEVEVDTEYDVTIEYYNGTTKLTEAPVNAGAYTVKAIYTGDANHVAYTAEAELVIAKANTTITAANVTKVYDETAAVVTATVSNGAVPTIVYNTTDGQAPVTVGAYTATVSYAGDENYNAAETVTVTITINKPGYAELTIELEDITIIFGETYEVEGTVTGSDKVAFEDLTIVFKDSEGNVVTTPVNAGTYSIVASYELNDDLLINAAVAQATLIINQVEVTFELEGNTEVTYDGNAHELTVDTEYDVTIEYYLGETKLDNKPVNAGTYTVKAIYVGDVNHKAYTATETLVIKQAEVTFELEGDLEVTYDGNAHELTVDTEYDVTIEYYLDGNKVTEVINAGTYTVKAIYAGDDNHVAKTVEATLIIKQAEVTLTVSETDIAITYGETYTITATVSNDDNETIVIEYYKGSTKLEAAPTDAGSYTAKVLYSYGNYAATPVTVTITIAAKVEFVMTGVQLRDKTFDKGIFAIKITSGENNVKYDYTFTINGDVDTTQETITVNATYKGQAYTLTENTIEQSPLMIYAVYGGGGNSGAPYKNDFVILYNSSSNEVSLEGYTIQYISGGNAVCSGGDSVAKLKGVVAPYSFYVIQCAAGNNASAPALPFTVDVECKIGIGASNLHIALIPSSTLLNITQNNNIIDLVGAGTASHPEGTAATAPNATTFIKRNSFVDTNNNKNDFVTVTLSSETFDFLEPGYVLTTEFTNIINNTKESNNFTEFTEETITLPITMLDGIVISWETSDEDVISINPTTGVVTVVRPLEELGETDVTVTLVAKINVGGVELTETCEVLVKAIPTNPNIELVAADKDALTLPATVVADFELPEVGSINGSTITWSIKSGTAIVLDGYNAAVIRPTWSENKEVEVVLIATLDKEGTIATKEIKLVVTAPRPTSVFETLPYTEAKKLAGTAHDVYTEKGYYLSGVISEIVSSTYGNLYMTDEEGNTFYVYGLYSYDGSKIYDAMTTKPAVGDFVVLYSALGCYSGTQQMKNAKLVQLDNTDYLEDVFELAKEEMAVATAEGLTVFSTITLPYVNYANIVWSVKEGTAITIENGEITVEQPKFEDGNATVKLLATVSLGELTEEFELNVTVNSLPEEGGQPQLQPKTTKYTFSSYAAGTQYKENEVHVLDDNTKITTTQCHFTSDLRIYASSTHNGYAIIESTNVITGFACNAGNETDTLNVYGSVDGTNWVLIQGISVTSSYKDYSITFAESLGYKFLKLDVKGSKQIRLKNISLTTMVAL